LLKLFPGVKLSVFIFVLGKLKFFRVKENIAGYRARYRHKRISTPTAKIR
jgi:hypothetical protein